MAESSLYHIVSSEIPSVLNREFNCQPINKEDIVKTVTGEVGEARQEITMTMLLSEELVSPLPRTYHDLILQKLLEGVEIRRIGFGNEQDFNQVVNRLQVESPNFRFDQISDISLYQRMILIDKSKLFFSLEDGFYRSNDPSLIDIFSRYSDLLSYIKSPINQPINVNPYFEEAQTFILKIKDTVPLTSAILDDWNPDGVNGARIIYGAKCVEDGKLECSDCLLFQAVGEDPSKEITPELKLKLRTSLFRPKGDQPSKQIYANCKTLTEYKKAYSDYIVEGCYSTELLQAELKWVKGFRILFLNGDYDILSLMAKEKKSKLHILETTLKKLQARSDLRRIQVISEYRNQIGLT